jgi:O-antigen/teichoic acid export membrane protein
MAFAARVARNTILQVVGKVIGAAIGLLVVALLTRYLHQSGYGQYATVLAYVGFLSVVADLGLYLVANRELALPNADQPRVVGNVVGIRLVSAILVLGAGVILAAFLPYPAVVRQGIAVATLAFLCIAVTQLLVAVFQVHLTMWPVVSGEILGRLVLLGAVVYGTTHAWGLVPLLTGQVAANAVNLALVLAVVWRFTPVRPRFEASEWKRILRDTLPIALSVVLNLIYFRIDTIFLSLLKPAAVVGLYSSAYKILEILAQFPAMFVGLVLPALSAAFIEPERFKIIFQRAFEVVVLAALPIVTGGILLAEPIVRFINGDEFAPAAPYLRILVVAVGLLYLSSLSGHAIVAIRKQRTMVWGYLGVAALGVVLYLVLIPPLSATGAAIGTVVTEFAIMAAGYAIILTTMRFSLRFGVVARGLVAAAALAGTLMLTPGLHLLLRIVLGAAVYALSLLLLRAFSWSFVREVAAVRGGATANVVDEV